MSAATDEKTGFFRRIPLFLRQVSAELKKVVWPTKKQLIHNTIMVVILVVALSVIVLGFDMILEFADAKLWDIIGRKIG